MENKRKRLSKRAIISIGLLISVVMMPITAIFIHVTHGLSISHFWLHLHVLFGVIFSIFGVIHFVYNWRVLKSYIVGNKISSTRN